MNLKKFIWLLAFPIAFTSCDEDPIEDTIIIGCMDELAINYNADAEEAGDCTFDAATVLQESTWLIQSVTAEIGGETINLLDSTSVLIPLCTHDNIFVFHADNSVSMEDNLDLCEEGEESILDLSGTWIVDGSVLTIENGTDVYVLTISNLTSSSMDLLFDYPFNENIDIPATIVLVAN
jgi:hypothetical protein